EVAMLLRHLGIADPKPTAARFVDQLPRLGARRVLEGRAAGPAAKGLARLPLGRDPVHLGGDEVAIALLALEQRLYDDGAFGHVAASVDGAEAVVRPGDALPVPQDQGRLDQNVRRLAVVSAGVHPDGPSDGPRYAAQKLEAGDPGVPGLARD